MDVFNKIKTQVSTVLSGNPISKDFEILTLTCQAGPGQLWKVFEAKNKNTKQTCSVWILEKKTLDKLSRLIREEVLTISRKGVVNLTKLRHPKILSVVHPLEESRDSLAFATESVYSNLSNLLSITNKNSDQKLYDIEIKYGMLQLCEALTFLHNDCKQLHMNICPDTIIAVKNGSWKLAGFEFSVNSATSSATSTRDASGDLVISVAEWSNGYHPLAQPCLNYCSPESALQGRALPSSDMFSLGLFIYTLFNNGKTLFDCQNDVTKFRENVGELNNIRMSLLQSLPESLREYIKLLLKNESTLRPDALQMTKIPYFNDSNVTTLQSMDNLFQLDNLARSHFYKSLPKFVMSMPKRINLHRVLPQLALEFNNNNMVPFVLPTVLQIADLCTDVEFSKYLLPKIIPVFNMTEPVQIILIILQNLNIMMSKCPEAEFKSYILPMLNKALEVDNRQTQELCLKILPSVAHLMAFSTLKSVIFPRLKKLLISSSIVQVKVSCLICIGQLMEHTDKWFVLDDVLPILEEIKSREPAVLMSIVGIYQSAFRHKKLGITNEVLANRSVPFLLPLAIDNNLNLQQYSVFMGLVQQMIVQIDQEHRSKLEKVNGIQEEYKSIPIEGGSTKPSDATSILMDEVGQAFGFTKTNTGSTINQLPQSLVQYQLDPASFTSGEGSSLNKTSNNLTMEQKQKLASQQEQMTRMKSSVNPSNPLTPNHSQQMSRPSVKPKDLTSTLIDKNFAMISNSQNSNWTSKQSGNSFQANYNISTNGNMQPTSSMPLSSSTTINSVKQPTIDLSAFDNLCNFNKPKSSLATAVSPVTNSKVSQPTSLIGQPSSIANQNQSRGGNIDDLLS